MPLNVLEIDVEKPVIEMQDALEEAERLLAIACIGASWAGAGVEFLDYLTSLGDRLSRAVDIASGFAREPETT